MNISQLSTPEIAGQRQIGRTAVDAAVEPADGRDREILEAIRNHFECRAGAWLVRPARGSLGDGAEVESGAEGAAGAGQDQHTNL